ncbi:monofunctional biosynthetic peptidoglycan transglycosylase, partial [Xanthomonas hortorum pv. vitians]|nr:monofunctional biosynthetic peptidoglycan transglycosylase [Xanthomonas hortorum pv. vitians]
MGTDALDGKQVAPTRRARRWLRWVLAAPLLF